MKHPVTGKEFQAPNPDLQELIRKQQFGKGLKKLITNQFNFKDLKNPFEVTDLSLCTLKKQRHADFFEKNR